LRGRIRAGRFRRISRAVFEESSGDKEEEDEDEDEDEMVSAFLRLRFKQKRPKTNKAMVDAIDAALCDEDGACRRRQHRPPFWVLDLTDTRPDDVGYVWLLRVQYDGVVARLHIQDMTAHDFCIENACGTCLVATPLDLWRLLGLKLRPFMVRAPPSARRGRRRAAARQTRHGTVMRHHPQNVSSLLSTGELIATLSGKFAPCANAMQVDFRGVRSIAAMLKDWALLIPEQAPSRV
jgi:hypothetical protein